MVENTTSILTPAWTPMRYHPEQARLWMSKARFRAVPAGRGSGKTELAKRYLVRMLPVAKEHPDPRYFYAAPTSPQAKRIAWNHLLRLIPKEWIADISVVEMRILTVFGSELHVVGLDRPQRIEGVQWDGGVVDESSDIKPGVFDLNISPALTWRDGWCWRIGVPKRFGCGAAEFKAFYTAACKGELESAQGFTWASKDILPAAALRFAQQNMDAKDYAEQFDATWQSASGGIFYAFSEDYNVRPCTYNPDASVLVCSDFNVDPMAWVLAHRYGDRLEVFDELWMRDANTPGALKALAARYGTHRGGFEFYGDATGKARKTAAHASDYVHIVNDPKFRELGRTLHYLHTNPPTADRFAATNALIWNANGERRLHVDPRCKHLIQDLTTRAYKPGERVAEDTGDAGHITDALGYGVYKLWPLRIPLEGRANLVSTT